LIEERKALLRQVNKEIDEIHLIVKIDYFHHSKLLIILFFKIDDMEREINKALPNSRASLTGKLKQYKRDIEIIEKELLKILVTNSFLSLSFIFD
jgi:hypothetical protein